MNVCMCICRRLIRCMCVHIHACIHMRFIYV
jgi:hypothetical protein